MGLAIFPKDEVSPTVRVNTIYIFSKLSALLRPTYEPQGEDDHAESSEELEYKVPELTDGEGPGGAGLLVEARAHDEDEDGHGDRRHGGEEDPSLGGAQLAALRHGAAQEQVVTHRGGAHQAGGKDNLITIQLNVVCRSVHLQMLFP